jgi:hypothetical protein
MVGSLKRGMSGMMLGSIMNSVKGARSELEAEPEPEPEPEIEIEMEEWEADLMVSKDTASVAIDFVGRLACNLHAYFARYDEIDELNVQNFQERTLSPPPMTAAERAGLEIALASHSNAMDWKRMSGTGGSLVEYYQAKIDNNAKSTSSLYGKAVAPIDAAAPRVLAYVRERSECEEAGLRATTAWWMCSAVRSLRRTPPARAKKKS